MRPSAFLLQFENSEVFERACEKVYLAGFRQFDAFSPFPIEGMAEKIGAKKSRVALLALIGGAIGALTAFGMQWYADVIDYPINVGGRPLFSWPAWVPITFELTVLFSAFAAVISMLALNGLPCLHHPVFDASEFLRASKDRYFIYIDSNDRAFDAIQTRAFAETLQPERIIELHGLEMAS